ncbi:hypothetical protein [Niallia sp. FSL R7-0271]|uniref:hypothetical protein n=1 Tax=Niallia sp. FSL R7-0271 TaxID=2921678 RepID=UPI0030F5B1D5
MKKIVLLIAITIIVIFAGSLVYIQLTDETYKGMSIIPEQHEDIPLFKGLEPTRVNYVSNGDHLNEVYEYYVNKLPELGWKSEYISSEFDDENPGFYSRWTKQGFEGELTILGSYNTFEKQTEVSFDQQK